MELYTPQTTVAFSERTIGGPARLFQNELFFFLELRIEPRDFILTVSLAPFRIFILSLATT